MDWAGTMYLSWWELEEFLRDLPHDKTSAVWRRINPDDVWSLDTLLLAEIASAASGSRFIAAAKAMGDEMPEGWGAKEFGPPKPDVVDSASGRRRTPEERKAVAARARKRAGVTS